jgi:RNA polymerase sigma factor (sigma-70 family)
MSTPTLDDLCRFAEVVAAERVPDWRDRQDAAQEGKIAAWRVLGSHPDASGAYLRTSVKNAIRSFLRGAPQLGAPDGRGYQRPKESGFELEEWEHPITTDSYPSDVAHVHAAIATLQPRDQALIALHFGAGLPLKEVSLQFGMNQGWASEALKNRILPALREQLKG